MSLNSWAYSPEEQEQLEEEQNLENRIMIETEIDGTVQKLRAIDLQLDDLGKLSRRITEIGGVDRSMAQEAMVIIPDFAERHKLNEFTTTPTSVKYQVSVEEISLSMALGIGSAIAAVTTLLYKFLQWLFGSSSKMSGGGGGGGSVITKKDFKPGDDTKEIKENLEKAGETAAEAHEAINGINKTNYEFNKLLSRGIDFYKDDKIVRVRSLQDLSQIIQFEPLLEIGRAIRNYADLDIATNGPMAQFFMKNLSAMTTAVDNTIQSIHILDDVEEGLMKLSDKLRKTPDEFRKSVIKNEMGILFPRISHIGLISDSIEEIRRITDGIRDAKAESSAIAEKGANINYFEFTEGYAKFGESFVRHGDYATLIDIFNVSVELAADVFYRMTDLEEAIKSIPEMPEEIIKDVTEKIKPIIMRTGILSTELTKIINFLNLIIGSYIDVIRKVGQLQTKMTESILSKLVISEENERAFIAWEEALLKLFYMFKDFEHLEGIYERERMGYGGKHILRHFNYDDLLSGKFDKAKQRAEELKHDIELMK